MNDLTASAGARQTGPQRAGRARHLAERHPLGRLMCSPVALFGLALFIAIALVAVFADRLYPGDPRDMVARPFLWPFQRMDYPLGTDSLGRDLASGIAHGARVSLFVGLVAAAIGTGVGVSLGLFAGLAPRWVEDTLMRLVEVTETMPNFVLLVVLATIIPPSLVSMALTIGLVSWAQMARLVRGEVRALRNREFVTAARSVGFGRLRIALREILPNTLPAITVMASVIAATAILMESALSFMGFGDPDLVSWGSLIGAGRESMRTAWYLTALPGLAIVLTVLALNLIGDGLNDALNPRRGRR